MPDTEKDAARARLSELLQEPVTHMALAALHKCRTAAEYKQADGYAFTDRGHHVFEDGSGIFRSFRGGSYGEPALPTFCCYPPRPDNLVALKMRGYDTTEGDAAVARAAEIYQAYIKSR